MARDIRDTRDTRNITDILPAIIIFPFIDTSGGLVWSVDTLAHRILAVVNSGLVIIGISHFRTG